MSSTLVHLPVIPILYRTRVLQVAVESVKRDYSEDRSRGIGPVGPTVETSADSVRLGEQTEQELLEG